MGAQTSSLPSNTTTTITTNTTTTNTNNNDVSDTSITTNYSTKKPPHLTTETNRINPSIRSTNNDINTTTTTTTIKKKTIAYFNNAGKTILPPSVQQAGIRGFTYETQPWTKDDTSSSTTLDVRKLFAKLIGANLDGSEIAICPSTGFALTMAAHNLFEHPTTTTNNNGDCASATSSSGREGSRSSSTIGPGDKILIVQDEMSSGVYCWQEICKLSGASLEIVQHPTADNTNTTGDDDDNWVRVGGDTNSGWTELVLTAIQKYQTQIAIVCVPQVHWSDGSLLNLEQIGIACRVNHIKFVIDATQSAGIFPINVSELQCDVLVASVHKWLLGPHGMSLVYIKSTHHDTWQPLDQHARSRVVFQNEVYEAGENLIGASGYPEEFVRGAARCDGGGKKNPILMPMVREGLRIVTRLDLRKAQGVLRTITDRILEGGTNLGFGVQPGPRAGHIIGLRPCSSELRRMVDPARMVDIAKRLEEKHDVYLAVRCGAFRIAPYLDTTLEEVDQLLLALAEECQLSILV